MNFIDTIPVWGVFIGTIAIVLLGFEIGYRINRHHQNFETETDGPISMMVNVILTLLAFMLAFSFSMSADRFNERRALIVEEANTIRTCYLRSRFLPESTQHEVRQLLREYLDVRLQFNTAVHDHAHPDAIKAIKRSTELQSQLWSETVTIGKANDQSNLVQLFIESVNQMFEIQSKRIAASGYARLPNAIWMVLYLLTMLGMAGIGYQSAAGRRSYLGIAVISLSFGMVVTLITDLERPYEGLIKTNVQPLIDLDTQISAQ